MSLLLPGPPRLRGVGPDATLQARGLTYGYRRDAPILDGLDLALDAGSMVALTGPSGTGKSTLLYLLSGLLTPWSGDVEVAGVRHGDLTDRARAKFRAREFGFVFQDVVLDQRRPILDSVLEPCLYARRPRRQYRDRGLALLAELGVELEATALPGEISGGQAQRVGVCRALLLEPTVIFADEPTGNLDNDSAAVVLDALRRATRGGGLVIVATHDDRVVARCDRRVELP